jgi:hypothetical protein
MAQGPGDSGSGQALTPSQLGPIFDSALQEEALPLGDYLTGALLEAVIGFTLVELEEAGEAALEANSDGSVGDQCGEPQLYPSYRNPNFSVSSGWSIHYQVSTLSPLGSPQITIR